MSSRDYWAQREEEALKHYIKDEKEYDKQINRIYSDMLDDVQKEINSFFGKYADKEGITIAEAKKRVSKLDIAAYERKAKRYVKDKDFSAKANEEMRLYNLTMKVNRLEMLKANIGLELIKGHDELDKFMGDILKGRTEEELKRQAGILGKTITNNAQLAHTIPNASFHNATFSDRIWLYQDLMRADLSKLLQTGLIQGKNPRVLARELKKAFGVSTYNAERLMRTELARVQTEAQKQSFEKNGFEQYTFIANSGCCDICQSLDGKHFKVADMMPAKNAAPMHPHCRCSTAAYSDRKEYEEWLDYLSNGGTTEEYNKLKAQGITPTKAAKPEQKKDSFTPAKTIEEAEAYAQKFVYREEYESKRLGKKVYQGKVSFGKMALEYANKFNEVMDKVFANYGIKPLNSIEMMNFRESKWKGAETAGGAYDAYARGEKGSMYFNPKIFSSSKALRNHIDEVTKGTNKVLSQADNLLAKSTLSDNTLNQIRAVRDSGRLGAKQILEQSQFAEATFVHEIGHLLDYKEFKAKYEKYDFDVSASMDKYGSKISGYAVSSTDEYIAESFVMYWFGYDDLVDPKLLKIFSGR